MSSSARTLERSVESARRTSNAQDTLTRYGWISIALHWIGAVLIIAIWIIGSSIESAGTDSIRRMHLHTSVAMSAYLLLCFRIAWRFSRGHPGPLPRQRGWAFTVGKLTHYLILVAVAIMLVTGPLMVWSRGEAIHVFGVAIPAPFSSRVWLASILYRCHVLTSTVLLLGVLLHIAGVFKHLAFNRDGTFDKIMVPTHGEESER